MKEISGAGQEEFCLEIFGRSVREAYFPRLKIIQKSTGGRGGRGGGEGKQESFGGTETFLQQDPDCFPDGGGRGGVDDKSQIFPWFAEKNNGLRAAAV